MAYSRLACGKKQQKHFNVFTELIYQNSLSQPATETMKRCLPLFIIVSNTYLSSQYVFVGEILNSFIRLTFADSKFDGDFIVSLFTKR